MPLSFEVNFFLLPFRFNWDQSICTEVQDQDLQGALKAFEEDVDPKNLAYIKFHPSSQNPHSSFADESYRPPKELTHLKNSPVIEGKERLFESDQPKTNGVDQIKQQTVDLAGAHVKDTNLATIFAFLIFYAPKLPRRIEQKHECKQAYAPNFTSGLCVLL